MKLTNMQHCSICGKYCNHAKLMLDDLLDQKNKLIMSICILTRVNDFSYLDVFIQ